MFFFGHHQLQVTNLFCRIMNGGCKSLEWLHTTSKGRLPRLSLAQQPVLARMDSAVEWAYTAHNPRSLAVLRLRNALNLRKYTKFLEDHALNVTFNRPKTEARRRRNRCFTRNEHHFFRKIWIGLRNFNCIRNIVACPLKSSMWVILLSEAEKFSFTRHMKKKKKRKDTGGGDQTPAHHPYSEKLNLKKV